MGRFFVDLSRMNPDSGAEGVDGALYIENLAPQARGRMASVATMEEQITSTEDFQYIFGCKLDPNLLYLAGPNNLYVWNRSAGTITDVFFGTLSGYPTGPDWNIVEFGTSVIAVPTTATSDPLIRLAHAGNFAALWSPSTPDPRAKCAATVRSHLFLGNIIEKTGGTVSAQRVWWSARDNPRDFAPSARTRAGFVDLTDGYGPITCIVGGDYALVFKTDAIHRFDFVGGETVWQQQVIARGVGCVGANAACSLGNSVYFRAVDGFYRVVDGITVEPIGQTEVWTAVSLLANIGWFGPWSDNDGGLSATAAPGAWTAVPMRASGLVAFTYQASTSRKCLLYSPTEDRWSAGNWPSRSEDDVLFPENTRSTPSLWLAELPGGSLVTGGLVHSIPIPGADLVGLDSGGDIWYSAGTSPPTAECAVVSKAIRFDSVQRVKRLRIHLEASGVLDDTWGGWAPRIAHLANNEPVLVPSGAAGTLPGDEPISGPDGDGWFCFEPKFTGKIQIILTRPGTPAGHSAAHVWAFRGVEVETDGEVKFAPSTTFDV